MTMSGFRHIADSLFAHATPFRPAFSYLHNVKRLRKHSKTKAVKAIARERVGSPKPARIVDEKPVRSKPKHKKKWAEAD